MPSAARIAPAAVQRLQEIAADVRLVTLLRVLEPLGGEAYLVGGAVRDAVIGRPNSGDLDVVVRGVALERLSDALSNFGSVSFVGKSFGVLKFRMSGSDVELDIAWPRTERAGMSGGYRDFAVQADPELPMERDLERRDFTVNAIAYRLDSGELVDPFGGLADIESRLLRAVGDVRLRFVEDHSRMLRAIRFACQLNFAIVQDTWRALCDRMPHLNDMRPVVGADGTAGEPERVVPYETVAKELVKAFAADPHKAATLLFESGALAQLMPEMRAMPHCRQSPDHHSEGNVWQHTLLALAKLREPGFAATFPDEKWTAETALAVLLHDVAKPECAGEKDGRITFYGHDHRGGEIAEAIARRLKLASAGVSPERLGWLVKMHLFPNHVDLGSVRRTTLAKHFLSDREGGRALLHLAYADASAAVRPDGSVDLDSLHQLIAVLATLHEREAPTGGKSLLSGEEVMSELDLQPGKSVGEILMALKEAQLKGEVSDHESAKAFIKALPGNSPEPTQSEPTQ